MSKRYVTLAVIIGLVLLVPSVPARAARGRTRQCTFATRSAVIQQDDGYPNVGTTAQAVGVFDQTCDSQKTHGVQEFKITINDISGVGGGGVNSISASVGSQVPVIHFTSDGIQRACLRPISHIRFNLKQFEASAQTCIRTFNQAIGLKHLIDRLV